MFFVWQQRPKATYLRQTHCLQPDNAERCLPVANNWCHAVRIGGPRGAKERHVSSANEPVSMEMLPTLYFMAGLFNSI